MFIQKEKDITQQEIDEYVLLLEKVMTYKTLIQILNDPNALPMVDKSRLNSCRKDRIRAVQQLEDWWQKMQKKYGIISNNKFIRLDFNQRKIIYHEKETGC